MSAGTRVDRLSNAGDDLSSGEIYEWIRRNRLPLHTLHGMSLPVCNLDIAKRSGIAMPDVQEFSFHPVHAYNSMIDNVPFVVGEMHLGGSVTAFLYHVGVEQFHKYSSENDVDPTLVDVRTDAVVCTNGRSVLATYLTSPGLLYRESGTTSHPAISTYVVDSRVDEIIASDLLPTWQSMTVDKGSSWSKGLDALLCLQYMSRCLCRRRLLV